MGKKPTGRKDYSRDYSELFVKLKYELLDSAAYKTLDNHSKALYTAMLRKWGEDTKGDSLKEFEFPRRCDKNPIRGTTSFANHRDNLIEHGFIRITRQGMGRAKISTRFTLSNEWRNWSRRFYEKSLAARFPLESQSEGDK
jgi:hypothetical protein